jgi:hypothetical protein
MLLSASELIDAGLISDACEQLEDACRRADGEAPPPDFVAGIAASELATAIWTLQDNLGCFAQTETASRGGAGMTPRGTESRAIGVIPERYLLRPNYPNPFSSNTVIHYDVPRGGGDVSLTIYDVSGKVVRNLVSRFETEGQKSTIWDATDDRGQPVSTGIYFYQLRSGEFSQTRKLLFVK